MTIRQGEVYLVSFGKKYHSEPGKKRPAIVMQTDEVNDLLEQMEYRSVAVVPLSSQRLEDAYFRVDIPVSGGLEQPSQAICNWICTVDLERFDLETGALCTVDEELLARIRERFHYLIKGGKS